MKAAARDRGAVLLSLGTVGSGVLAYAFNAVAARALGPEGYGPVAVLWATVFLVSIVLFRPVEQTLSRWIAHRLARGEDPRPVVRTLAGIAIAMTVAAVLGCLAAWRPITDRLFDGHAALTAALAGGIAGYGCSYFVRGLAGGRRWFAGYGWLLLVDGVVRVVLAIPLLIWTSPSIAGVAVVGAAIGGALAPVLARGRRGLRHGDAQGAALRFRARDAAAFGGPVMLMAAADQVLVSGGPLLVVLDGGKGAVAAAGTVFAATMLVRAPRFLFQGFAAALLPSLTTFDANGDEHRFRRAVLQTALVLGGFALLLTSGALAIGPEAMRLLYGAGFDAGRGDLALLGAGVGAYLAASTFSQAALARGDAAKAGAIWLTSAGTFVVLQQVTTGSPLHRVALAFIVAAVVNALLFAMLVTRRERRMREPVAAPALG